MARSTHRLKAHVAVTVGQKLAHAQFGGVQLLLAQQDQRPPALEQRHRVVKGLVACLKTVDDVG